MKTMIKLLSDKVSKAFEACGYAPELGEVTVSDRMDLCQFQCNGAFAAAKRYRKAPMIVAKEVVSALADDEDFQSAEVAGAGFINLTVTDRYLLRYASAIVQDEAWGIPQAEAAETIVIDYGGPNVAKPLHIGHLRSAIIGEALKRLARAFGYTVYGDVHLGDWGLQMGLVIAELEERNPNWRCFAADFDPQTEKAPVLSAQELNEIYPFASKKSKENPEFKLKAQAATARLQKGDAGYYALWQEIIRVSVADMKKNYERLNVSFDYWYGESDAEKYVPELLKVLNAKQLLHESNGAMVVDVAQETDKLEIPPVIIKKSDDSNIYATTDLATIIQRNLDFAPAYFWYVVDKRQSLHFTQVFRCARKAGIVKEEQKLEHLGFGTMNGADGKPYKTRDGGVMQLEELYGTVYQAAYERTEASALASEGSREDIAAKIAVAAIKFGDLINHRAKDYVFDLDKFLASEGKTGTFLLYTIARINSVMKKAEFNGEVCVPAEIYSDSERELWLKLALSGSAFEAALSERAPNYICENAYQLASLFSKFYHDHHILSEQDPSVRSAWLALCAATKQALLKHLDILGIEPVESM